LICVFAGSGLIANDLKSNALQLYLSKPLTRFDYIAGKSATILIMLECITFIPGVLLFLEHSVLSQDLTFLSDQYWLLGAIFLYSLILNVPITFLTLALSSITKNNRYSAIILMSIIIGSPVLGALLKVIFRSGWVDYVPYWYNIGVLGRNIFGLPGNPTAWHWSAPIMAILTAVCIWIMYRKVKGVEIVK
jgi:ABC-type transport system involved in multi-copper enzyme maturation permease subunit